MFGIYLRVAKSRTKKKLSLNEWVSVNNFTKGNFSQTGQEIIVIHLLLKLEAEVWAMSMRRDYNLARCQREPSWDGASRAARVVIRVSFSQQSHLNCHPDTVEGSAASLVTGFHMLKSLLLFPEPLNRFIFSSSQSDQNIETPVCSTCETK